MSALSAPSVRVDSLPSLDVAEQWEEIFEPAFRSSLESALPAYLRARRWFGSKAREIKSVAVHDAVEVSGEPEKTFITFLNVDYVQGDSEMYLLPLAWTGEGKTDDLHRAVSNLAIARLKVRERNREGILYDAIGSKVFSRALLDLISRRRSVRGRTGELAASQTSVLRRLRGEDSAPLEPSAVKSEQSNSAVIYGDRLILKLFRKLEAGINPDQEIGRFLTEKEFGHIAPFAGALEYRTNRDETFTLAVVNEFVAGAKDAWEYTLDALSRYHDRALTFQAFMPSPPRTEEGAILSLAARDVPTNVAEIVGTYLESARLLGQRTAEMHAVLASETENKNFAPEPLTSHYQRALFQSMRNQVRQNLQLLRERLKDLPESARSQAQRLAGLEEAILKKLRLVFEQPIATQRIRYHGDFHLGQVLCTGKDFVMIDFEGEPARPLSERRIKRSGLRDVAGMLRSFHYAAHAGLLAQIERGSVRPGKIDSLQEWARFWQCWVSVGYLKAYFATAAHAAFLPKTAREIKILLDAFLIEKAIYELGYELNHRPDWVNIPIQGILQLLESNASGRLTKRKLLRISR